MIGNSTGSLVNLRRELLLALALRGLEVHVAAPGFAGNSAACATLKRMGVHVHDIPLQRVDTNPLSDLVFCVRLYHLMRRLKPSTVLAYTIKAVIYGTVAGWLARIPERFALITGLGHAFTGNDETALRRLITRMYAFALARTSKIFLQNPDDLALFRAQGVIRSRVPAIVVNGSGVDLVRFAARATPAGPLRFLMVSRLLGDKGVREYAAAAKRIRVAHPQVTCALAGGLDANPASITEAELDRWVSAGTIDYLGVLTDVRPALAACSVFVLPSYYREGTPRSTLEAMASGRAIITTDAPGCRETVVDGQNGFLVPVKSVDALVAAMKRFIDEPGLMSRMGAASRRIAEDKYDVHEVNAVMLREMGITP